MLGWQRTHRQDDELFYRLDKASHARAVLIIHHGFAEHLGRYDHVAAFFRESGYHVLRFDAQGHGLSRTELGHLESYKDFIADFDLFVEMMENQFPKLPIFTLGHSMGGMVTLMYALTYPEKIQGQVFSGAASSFLPMANNLVAKTLDIGTRIAPKISFRNIVEDDICSDPQVVRDYKNDGLVLKQASLNFFQEFLFKAPQYIENRVKDYDLSCLILHGKEDKIVPVELSQSLYEKIASKDKSLIIYEGLYHEILNEAIYPEILEDILSWLDEQA